jgi:hypothetical protein
LRIETEVSPVPFSSALTITADDVRHAMFALRELDAECLDDPQERIVCLLRVFASPRHRRGRDLDALVDQLDRKLLATRSAAGRIFALLLRENALHPVIASEPMQDHDGAPVFRGDFLARALVVLNPAGHA